MTDEQFGIITNLLMDIRDALIAPEVAPVESGCAHPEDQRVSLATPHQPDHWICHACRYEHHGITHN